tara:strand:+ start:479 stop:703 length:225 start_codon:yes stop_codon:yes gene_type:complete
MKKGHRSEDNEALVEAVTTFLTLGLNHAYIAARVTYFARWGTPRRLERERVARVLAVEVERERRYAAIGVECRW